MHWEYQMSLYFYFIWFSSHHNSYFQDEFRKGSFVFWQGFAIEIGADYFGDRARWVFFLGCGELLICLRGVRVRWVEWFIWRWGDRNDSFLILYYLPIYSHSDHANKYSSQNMSFTIFVWSDVLKTTKTYIFSICKKNWSSC